MAVTLASTLRALSDRISALENRRRVIATDWVIETRESDGALVARHAPSGAVVLLAEAPAG